MSKFALIIGNSEYNDKNLSCLTTPTADVRALAEVLLDKNRGGFDAAKTLINESDSIIRKEIVRFFAEKKKDDLLLLYFSGHGVMDDHGRLYLAAQDTESGLLSASAISANFITDTMDSSRSKRKVLILDCCHSGAFFRDTKAVTGAKAVTKKTFEGDGYGKVVLTATDSTQYAWSSDDQVIGKTENSVFTHFLIEGLRGAADTDSDGRITLDELYDYVAQNISSKQTPTKWAYNQQGELLIATNPFPIIKPAPLSGPLLEAIEDPRSFVREGAVRELERLLKAPNKGVVLAAGEALERIAADENTSQRVSKLASEILEQNAAVVTPIPPPEPFEPVQPDVNAASEQARKQKEQAAKQREDERKRTEEKLRIKVAELENEVEAAAGKKDWSAAVVKLRALLLLNPGHPNAAARLKDVLKKQEEAKRQKEIDDLQREAQAAENKEDWATVIEKRQALLALEPDDPESTVKLSHARQQQELACLYDEGQKAYANHDWTRALSSFEEVERRKAGYKDTIKLIADTQQKITEQADTEEPPSPSLATTSGPRDSLEPEVQPEMFTGFTTGDQIRRFWPLAAAAGIVLVIVIVIVASYSSSNRPSSQAETRFNGSPMPTSTGYMATTTPSVEASVSPTPGTDIRQVDFEQYTYTIGGQSVGPITRGRKLTRAYGDLNNDDIEEAAVLVSLPAPSTDSFGTAAGFVYMIKKDGKGLQETKYFCDYGEYGIARSTIQEGQLKLGCYDFPEGKFIIITSYKLEGRKLVQVGRPVKVKNTDW